MLIGLMAYSFSSILNELKHEVLLLATHNLHCAFEAYVRNMN